jgi:nitrite reductase/ring-hydroxylating ferredoxin subunit
VGAPAASTEDVRALGKMWVQAAGVRPDEVVDGSVHQVNIFGTRYALYKTDDGEFFASSDSCPHAGGPLGEGELDGFVVTCPFHSFTYDIRDGSCTSGADLTLKCVAVKVEGDKVLLETPQ